MTAAPAETAPSTHFAEIPAKHLTPHPKNVRVDVGDVTDLAASIKTQGVLQPLVVAPMAAAKGSRSKTQQYVVIAGHRRLAAATTARLTVLPCVVREDLVGEAEQLQAMLVENGQRTDLTPVEEGDAYRALTLDYGVPVKDLAKNIGRSQQLVRSRITLAGSPDSVRSRVIAGQVPIEHAIELASFDDFPEVHDELARHLGGNGWSWALADARNARTAAEAFAKELRTVERSLTRRIDVEPDGDAVATLHDLGEAAAEVAFLAAIDARPEGTSEDDAEDAAVAAAEKARATFTVEEHLYCVGHCAYVREPAKGAYNWRPGLVQYCCDQPTLHAAATGWESAGDRDAEDAARAAKEREQEEKERELAAALATATVVRRTHLAAQAERTTDKGAVAVLIRLIGDKWASHNTGRSSALFADIAGINLAAQVAYDPDAQTYEDWRAASIKTTAVQRTQLAAQLSKRPLTELVGLLEVAGWLDDELSIAGSTGGWPWERAKPYLRALAASGYTWSPVEAQLLPIGVAVDITPAS